MIHCQYEMWMHVFKEYIVFMQQEGKHMSGDFRCELAILEGIFVNCISVESFEPCCTEPNLYRLCDLTMIVVSNGAARKFPQWTYLVTQFQLFVLEVQRKAQSKSEMAGEDLHTMRSLLTQLKAL